MSLKPHCIILAGESREDVEEVRHLIRVELGVTVLALDASQPSGEFDNQAASLVFVFREIDRSAEHYLEMLQTTQPRRRFHHKAFLVCEAAHAERAYTMCTSGVFDDYVLFWPAPDKYRLQTLLWRADQDLLLQQAVEGGRPRILVVEDDPFQQKIIRNGLAEENLYIQMVETGVAAVAMAARLRPHLVLMDIDLPDMDGVAATRRLKSIPALAQTPIVMVTGNSNRQTVVASMEAGASDFLVKPLVRDRLIAKVRQRLGKLGTGPVAVQPGSTDPGRPSPVR